MYWNVLYCAYYFCELMQINWKDRQLADAVRLALANRYRSILTHFGQSVFLLAQHLWWHTVLHCGHCVVTLICIGKMTSFELQISQMCPLAEHLSHSFTCSAHVEIKDSSLGTYMPIFTDSSSSRLYRWGSLAKWSGLSIMPSTVSPSLHTFRYALYWESCSLNSHAFRSGATLV